MQTQLRDRRYILIQVRTEVRATQFLKCTHPNFRLFMGLCCAHVNAIQTQLRECGYVLIQARTELRNSSI